VQRQQKEPEHVLGNEFAKANVLTLALDLGQIKILQQSPHTKRKESNLHPLDCTAPRAWD